MEKAYFVVIVAVFLAFNDLFGLTMRTRAHTHPYTKTLIESNLMPFLSEVKRNVAQHFTRRHHCAACITVFDL